MTVPGTQSLRQTQTFLWRVPKETWVACLQPDVLRMNVAHAVAVAAVVAAVADGVTGRSKLVWMRARTGQTLVLILLAMQPARARLATINLRLRQVSHAVSRSRSVRKNLKTSDQRSWKTQQFQLQQTGPRVDVTKTNATKDTGAVANQHAINRLASSRQCRRCPS